MTRDPHANRPGRIVNAAVMVYRDEPFAWALIDADLIARHAIEEAEDSPFSRHIILRKSQQSVDGII